MTILSELREQIHLVDIELVQLLKKRMQLAIQIGEQKIIENLPIVDQNQENHVLDEIILLAHDPIEPEQLKTIFTTIIQISRDLQMNLLLKDEKGKSV